MLAALLGIWLNTLWERHQLTQTLRAVVAREDEALLAGDAAALDVLIAPEAGSLKSDLITRAGQGRSVFDAAHPRAWPLPEPGQVQAAEPLQPNLVRVDVRRRYALPDTLWPEDNATFSYVVPQFYRRSDAGWRRTTGPDSFWGETQHRTGAYVHWEYPQVDAAFVSETAPYLESVLERACAEWRCRDEFPITLELVPRSSAAQQLLVTPSEASPLISLAELEPIYRWGETVSIPSPHAAGLPVDAVSATDAPRAYATGCGESGLALWSPGDEAPIHRLPGFVPTSYPIAWSPDGQRLLIQVANRRQAVVAFATRQLVWLPNTNRWSPAHWINETLLAYIASPTEWLDFSNASLRFLDTANPEASPAPVPDLTSYLPSPDGSRAAVNGPIQDANQRPLGVMPARGGAIQWIAPGDALAWSPDSRRLAYFRHVSGTIELRVFEPESNQTRTLLRSADLETIPLFARFYPFAEAAWSPDGERLAFAITLWRDRPIPNQIDQVQIGLAHADGSDVTRLLNHTGPVSLVGFSADGTLLAIHQQSNPGRESQMVIYDAHTGDQVQTIPEMSANGWQTVAWSSTGHELMLVRGDGLYRLREPRDPQAQAEPPGHSCPWVLPNPTWDAW